MSEPTKIAGRRFRDILGGVPRTVSQPAIVTAFRSWDRMEQAIVAANNYLVGAQAERAKAERALEDAKEAEADATEIFEKAKAAWIEQSKTLLGIGGIED